MRNSGVFLGKEALGSWVRELRADLDLGFLDFLFVFSLDKTVPFIMCKVIKSFSLQLCHFELIWQQQQQQQQQKKKNLSKMTWQLTAKSNRG